MATIKVGIGYVMLALGLLALLAAMRGLYPMGILGTLFGFIVVIPLLTVAVYSPATKLITAGRKELAARALDS